MAKIYRCKNHKEKCRSYVNDLAIELTKTQREPNKEELELVEWVEE